jgi:glyoxylase-like metal-dependent hydrolase (beta-lactamase superfamily II)
VTDERLRELGIWRFPIPTPFSGSAVNVYLIEDAGGGVALLDTGVSGREATGALAEAFCRLGIGLGDVRRIIVTHGHPDHFGAAQWIVEHAGRDVPVLAHPGDIPKIDDSGPPWAEQLPRYEMHLARHGVPHDVLLQSAYKQMKGEVNARRVSGVQSLADGQILRFRHFEATVLHLPGHTPGLVCLFDGVNGTLFSSDHLLEDVAPSFEVELGPDGRATPFRPLVEHLDSLRLTRSLDVRTVLPGHGAPFGRHREVVDNVLRVCAERQARISEQLANGPKTAWGIARALFPRSSSTHVAPTLFQTLANLEVLEARNEVVREETAGKCRFTAA